MNPKSLLLLSALALAWPLAGTVNAQPNGQAPQNEFTNRQFGKLATTDADILCASLYDSASPVSMAIELVSILGPAYLFSGAPDITGYSVEKRKELFTQLRSLAKRKVWLPVTVETMLGDWLHERSERENASIPVDQLVRADRRSFDRIQALLDKVISELPNDNPYKIQLGVTRGLQSNASIMPGGRIYVTQGMLRDRRMSDPEISLRLAHEVGHLTRRHALKDLQLKLIDAMEIAKDIKVMANLVSTDPLKSVTEILATVKATELLFQRFEFNQELEGDACGMQLIRKAHPDSARAALTAYAAQMATGDNAQGWAASHPPYEERVYVMNLQLDDDARQQFSARGSAGGKASGTSSAPPGSNNLGPSNSGTSRDTSRESSDGVPTGGSSNGPRDGIGGFFDRIKALVPAGAASAPASPPASQEP